MYCPCRLLETHHIECPWCGAELEKEQQYCSKCNNELMQFEDDKKFQTKPELKSLGIWNFVYVALCTIAIVQVLYGFYLYSKLDVTNYWGGFPYYLTYAITQGSIHLLCLIISVVCILKRLRFVPKIIIIFEVVYLIFMLISYYVSKVTPVQNVNYIWLILGRSSKIIWISY
ncbi:zinc-ribbon domain-containing protein [Paenibacillus sp. GCM10027628]|uniref:zinc-ribbon domain-containing protein n=1 Tax=Paenibacillus sp. GCM10027628 TaxID=3273413 RepID=UPI003636E588